MNRRFFHELAFALLLAGTLAGLGLGLAGGLRGGGDSATILWKGALGAAFGAFLMRLFVGIMLLNLRPPPKESTADSANSSDIQSSSSQPAGDA